jgi:GMP synthase (glutamine-hydrolysing)
MNPFLILQLRTEDVVADNEYEAFLRYGGLHAADTHRIRMERESLAGVDLRDYAGVIVGGGPSNVSDEEAVKPAFQRRFEAELRALYDQIFAADHPYLGSCYGLGSVVSYAGGEVSTARYAEAVGLTTIHLNEQAEADPLLAGLPTRFAGFVGHKEACQGVPAGGVLLASSAACPVQIVRFRQNIYATQFHVELDAPGISLRIQYYKDHGYFEPATAQTLIETVQGVEAPVPHQILRRFVDQHRR